MEMTNDQLKSLFECISTVDGNCVHCAADVFSQIVRSNTLLEPIAKEVWEAKFKREVPWSQDL
jgi:hypothetical protein